MEDRYDISVDISDGKDWWFVYGLTTHDKVYELNKQMCDLGKTMNDPMKPLSEEAIQEIAKALEITRKPKDIMKEKKTMTKAEAFEYLKEKKINCMSCSYSQVQATLFEIGMRWCTGDKNIAITHFLFIDKNGEITHCGNNSEYFRKHVYPQISAEEVLSIEIKEKEENILDEIKRLGKEIMELLPNLGGHKHVTITEDNVILYDEGMCLFHSDPF